jgi:uncharacterized protein YndB with AHSA1/START domain
MAVSRAANSDTFIVTAPSDRQIILTRLFDAPRELVFDAMTKPEHVRRWWGILDDTYSLAVCEIDLRVGGKWRFVGGGPQGQTAFHGEYREIDRPERLVYTEIFEPFEDNASLVTQVLTEEDGKTRMTLTCEYPSREVRDIVLSSGMETGAGISYDRLEEVAMSLRRL